MAGITHQEWLTNDHLARRLEQTEASVAAEFARTHAQLFPQVGASVEMVAGGVAVFAEADSPMTQAVGIGMQSALTEVEAAGEIDRMEEFFRTHGAAANVEFCPHADNALRQAFAQRGYVVTEQTNMLARRLDGFTFTATAPGLRVRQPEPAEYETLARAVAVGFQPEVEPPPMMIDLVVTFLRQPSATGFLCEVDGELVGGGVVAVIGDAALLFATSTRPEWRGRGAQRALINARLEFAQTRDCTLALAGASPGSISHRNLERSGFRVVYTRAKLFHPLTT